MKNYGFLWKQIKDLKKERDELKKNAEKREQVIEFVNDNYEKLGIKLETQRKESISLMENYVAAIGRFCNKADKAKNELADQQERHARDLAGLNAIIEAQNIELSRDIEIIKNLKTT